LIWWSTLGCIVGYLGVCAFARWVAIERDIAVPRYQELILVVALGLAGIALGQVVRQARTLAFEFAARMSHPEGQRR
jgi:hypothetical protein